ncbi:putative RNA-directed DNA polymerase, eukaryota, reverse transcriptase zinc-binding domain protein [Tanacetum coccineum]
MVGKSSNKVDSDGWTWIFRNNKESQAKHVGNPSHKEVEGGSDHQHQGEGGVWTRVERKHKGRKQGGFNDGRKSPFSRTDGRARISDSNRVMKDKTYSFFFTNFQETWDSGALWKMFSRYGNVVDVYVAFKRTKKGFRFVFVRFINIGDVVLFERKLKTILIGEVSLVINIAKYYKSEGAGFSDSDLPAMNTGGVHRNRVMVARTSINRSFKDVVSGPKTPPQYVGGVSFLFEWNSKDIATRSMGENLVWMQQWFNQEKNTTVKFGKLLEVGRLNLESNVLGPIKTLNLKNSMRDIGQPIEVVLNNKSYPVRIFEDYSLNSKFLKDIVGKRHDRSPEESLFEEECVGPSMEGYGGNVKSKDGHNGNDSSSEYHDGDVGENEKSTPSPRRNGYRVNVVNKGISLNCNGLGCANKKSWINNLINSEASILFGVQETKLRLMDDCTIRSMWTRSFVDYAFSSFMGASNTSLKEHLWSSIDNIVNESGITWILFGDFNAVRHSGERAGSTFDARETSLFNDFIARNGLFDFPLNGRRFTRFDSGGFKASKLDRFVTFRIFRAEACLNDVGDIIKREEWVMDVNQLDQMHREDLKQKCRMRWAIEGEENSRFFHSLLKCKYANSNIKGIHVNGSWRDDPDEIKKAAADYFSSGFKEPIPSRPAFLSPLFKMLFVQEACSLKENFSLIKIMEAVWGCAGSKALGPDGFNFNFIKAYWEILKDDIVGCIKHFESTCMIANGCNPSFITLVPKNPDPLGFSDYKPSSLIGCVYKIISKILANRLAKVIKSVIGPNQSAFIVGRQILDGCLIANGIIRMASMDKTKLLLFKVDFKKAFDSVNWSFLQNTMRQMGFGTKWKSWIASCLSSTSISILVNGSPSKEFKMERGLRQGDPLSPFLFLMVVEALQISILEACEKGLYKGVYLPNNGANLSLLQYADDALFFSDWSRLNAIHLIYILKCFELASGLKVNIAKSRLMGVGVSIREIDNLASSLGFAFDSIPFTYLGLPVRKKMSLSIGGRLTLVKSVLGSLPIYYLSLFKAPSLVIDMLESLRRRFFWGFNDSQRGINWVKWDSILAGVKDGGLGVGSIFAKNLSFLCKWKWRLYTEKDALWLVDGLWRGKWSWRVPPKGRSLDDISSLITLMENFHLNPLDLDKWSWMGDASGQFKRASIDRLPTRSNLAKRGVDLSSVLCCLCNREVETLDQYFISCPRVITIWRKIWSWWNLTSPPVFPSFSIQDIAKGWVKTSDCSRTNKVLNGVLHCSLWSIWKWRNRVSHVDSDSTPTIIEEDIFPAIQRISKTWMSARLKSPLANWNNWISRPSDIFLS